jgi:hypothetical protein
MANDIGEAATGWDRDIVTAKGGIAVSVVITNTAIRKHPSVTISCSVVEKLERKGG